jgi:A/G-specific adenine glycosylase
MKFSDVLTRWYLKEKRALPWRLTKDPYCIWLSEIILQQTQIKQGLPYYTAFLKQFPSVFDLAKASEHEVLKLWQGLGYYSRARNLHFTAKHIVSTLNGEFPKDYDGLIKLKGVGDYTASAIASICYEEPCAVLDGNVYRVLSRYFGIKTPINSTQGKKEFKGLAQSLLPNHKVGDYNQAIMEFGAKQCIPKVPKCADCPLNSSCYALQKQKVAELPVNLKKIKLKRRYINYLVLVNSKKQTVLQQRKNKGIWQGLYEFQNIETSSSVSHDAISQLIKYKFNNLSLFNTEDIVHRLTHQELKVKFWIVEVDVLPEKATEVSQIMSYPVPVLIQNFIRDFNF